MAKKKEEYEIRMAHVEALLVSKDNEIANLKMSEEILERELEKLKEVALLKSEIPVKVELAATNN